MDVARTLQEGVDWVQANPWAGRALAIVVVWTATLLFVRFNARLVRMLDARSKGFAISPRTLHRLDRTADGFAVVVAALLTLGFMGVTGALWGALTAIGVAGIIIGFAAKDAISNLFAGLIILIEHPFMPGDAIDIAGVGGIVKSVSLRSTVLTTWDGRQVTMPNAKFIDNSVVNYSANPTRRVDAQVAILHESDVVGAIRVLQEIAAAYPHGVPGREPYVRVADLRESAVVLELWFWVEAPKYFDARTHAFVEITRRFREEKIDLAVPLRRTLMISEESRRAATDADDGAAAAAAAAVGADKR